MNSPMVEVDHERPGLATCLNLGVDPESTIGKIICGQASALEIAINENGRLYEERRVAEEQFHKVMECMRKMKMQHGTCEPRERRACSHCNGADDLQKIIASYKGARVVLA